MVAITCHWTQSHSHSPHTETFKFCNSSKVLCTEPACRTARWQSLSNVLITLAQKRLASCENYLRVRSSQTHFRRECTSSVNVEVYTIATLWSALIRWLLADNWETDPHRNWPGTTYTSPTKSMFTTEFFFTLFCWRYACFSGYDSHGAAVKQIQQSMIVKWFAEHTDRVFLAKPQCSLVLLALFAHFANLFVAQDGKVKECFTRKCANTQGGEVY